MFSRKYFTFFLAAVLFLVGNIAAIAQTAPVTGRVELKKTDGTTAPVADALVEVYRMDIKAKLPSAKTGKKGDFSFAGLPLGATFAFSVSGPGIKPELIPNIKAGSENLVISVTEGDGKKWTEAEVRQAIAGGSNGSTNASSGSVKLTEEQKKAQEDRAKLEAEYAEKKKKVESETTIIQTSLKEGNDAFNSKNYDVAIAKYEQGIQANPTYVGSAPVLMNNKATVLKERAVDFHNQGVKATDATIKVQNNTKSKKDFADAVDTYNASWAVLKNAPAADIQDQQSYQANKTATLNGFRNLVKAMVQTEKVEPEKVPTIAALLEEYLAFETDAAKKGEAQVFLADVYRIMGDSKNAIVEYKKVLAASPDNADALAGLGLSLANAGYNVDGSINEPMMQEAINTLQRFTDVAPDNHKLKASVKETVDYLKTQNLKPTKSTKKKT